MCIYSKYIKSSILRRDSMQSPLQIPSQNYCNLKVADAELAPDYFSIFKIALTRENIPLTYRIRV